MSSIETNAMWLHHHIVFPSSSFLKKMVNNNAIPIIESMLMVFCLLRSVCLRK